MSETIDRDVIVIKRLGGLKRTRPHSSTTGRRARPAGAHAAASTAGRGCARPARKSNMRRLSY